MAFQYVRSFQIGDTFYVERYDPETGQSELIQQGPTAAPQYLTPQQLGSAEGEVVLQICVGTTLHVVKTILTYPFSQGSQIANSPDCGYVEPPPPQEENPGSLSYGLVYRMTFSNMEQGFKEDAGGGVEACTVLICDGHSLVRGFIEPQILDIEPTGDPLRFSTIDNSESKFTPIRATQVVFQFYSTDAVNLNTFADSEDDRWKVIVQVQNATVFTGFLVLDDLDENFNFHPNAVTLTATDGLGLLKSIELKDFDGKRPRGCQKIISFIAWALAKTGLELDIKIVDNLFEESYPDLPAFDNIYLNAKTFEGSQIATLEDCYTVLSKILKDEYTLFQWQNSWWIVRIDEYENRDFSYFRFYANGNYVNRQTGFDATRTTGENQQGAVVYNIEHVEEQTYINLQRACKEIEQTFNYVFPKELIDNSDFSRGNWLTPVLVPNKTVDGNSYNGLAYALDDWRSYKGTFGSTIPANGTAYILRYFFENIERERYLSLTSNTLEDQFTQSNPIPVHTKDRIGFTVDFRFEMKGDVLGATKDFKIRLILKGDDGIDYILIGDAKELDLGVGLGTKWVPYSGQDGLRFYIQNDSIDWFTIKAIDQLAPIPVDGDLFILLPYARRDVVHYQNLQFTYTPYINGGYAEHKGQSHTITQTGNYKAFRGEDVFISDSPKKLFKGAMFKLINGVFVLTGRWYNGAVFQNGLPTDEYLHSRGRTQAFSIWNQYNRTFRILDSRLDGLETTLDVTNDGLPGVVHKWRHADATPHTTNRVFLLLHYEMDFNECLWNGLFAEVFSEAIEKRYNDPYTFKYVRA